MHIYFIHYHYGQDGSSNWGVGHRFVGTTEKINTQNFEEWTENVIRVIQDMLEKDKKDFVGYQVYFNKVVINNYIYIGKKKNDK